MHQPILDIACYGTSLTTGRLSGTWASQVEDQLSAVAGLPVRTYPMGKGSQTSDWGKSNAFTITALRPRFILTEGFAINDCAMGVSRDQHKQNIRDFVGEWRASNPAVDITIQTMSPSGAGRPTLEDYYQDERDIAVELGIRLLDNYPVWPNPMTAALTNAGDLLHPSDAAVKQYLVPHIVSFFTPILQAAAAK